MDIALSPEQIGVVIVAVVLGAQGLIKELNRRKNPPRGCRYGDEAHDALKAKMVEHDKLLMELLQLLRTHDENHWRTNDRVIQILAILGERR